MLIVNFICDQCLTHGAMVQFKASDKVPDLNMPPPGWYKMVDTQKIVVGGIPKASHVCSGCGEVLRKAGLQTVDLGQN